MKAYRYVFGDIDHQHNFLPVLLITPKRVLKNDTERCSGYALSFFDTPHNARLRYSDLKKSFPNIKNKLGDHIAAVQIEESDGVSTKPGKNGHFDFHEYQGVNLRQKITEVEQI